MIAFSRGIRLVWLLGFILLLGSVLGAGWVFNQGPVDPVSSPAQDPARHGINGGGYVDVEGGTSFLHPVQPGKVQTVYVTEGEEIVQGALLLSLDNSAQKQRLREAEIDLAVARQQLADAERLIKDHAREVSILSHQVDVARANLEGATKEHAFYESLLKSDPPQTSQVLVEVKAANVKAVASEVKAREEGLAKLKDADIQGKINLAKLNLDAKIAQRDLAQLAYFECDLYAPSDGVVLRLYATPGDLLNAQSKQPAVHFCPKLPRIVRVEVLQEWANKVKEGQLAIIEDDTRYGAHWKGKVERVSGQMTQRRSMLQDPFQYNDVRTLECIVSIEPGGPPVRIGQRMRVTIKQGGL